MSEGNYELASLQYLNVRQVAELLGVHPRTVWRLVSSGDLPQPIKISAKVVRWRVADLEAHLAGTDR
jgi:excisionase family DNA binding protein